MSVDRCGSWAEKNLQSKSLKTFVKDHHELHGVRFSMADYKEQECLVNVSIYGLMSYLEHLQDNQ